MPHSLLRGRWLRMVSTCAVLSLSIAAAGSLNAADGPGTADHAVRGAAREAEFEDNAQYPGLTMVKPGASSKAVRKQAIADIRIERLSPDAQRKSNALLKNVGM